MSLDPLRLATDGFFGPTEGGLTPESIASIAGAVWDVLISDHLDSGSTGASLATSLSLIQAFTTGRFQINYGQSKAYQYNRDGTLLQEFNLLDADGNPAISAQTAVDRVPVGEANPAIPVVGLSGLVYWS
jgi:hypothetical protein